MSKRAIFLGGKRAAGAGVPPSGGTFEEAPSSEWRLSDFAPDPAIFSTSISSGGASMGANTSGFFAYGMRWELDIDADTPITSATLVVRTLDDPLHTNVRAEMFIGQHQSDDSGVPANGAAAVTATSRCGSAWSGAADLFGGSGAVKDTEYSIDVKSKIEYSLGLAGWSNGNGLTLILCGPAADIGFGCATQAVDIDSTRIHGLLGGGYGPMLTVVYT